MPRYSSGPFQRANGNLRIVYTGAIDAARDPEPIFRAVRKLLDEGLLSLELIFMVPDSSRLFFLQERYKLKQVVHIIPAASYWKALELAFSADALLVIEANTEHGVFLPSKFVDYCQIGKPILALTPRGSELSDYLARGGGIAVLPRDVEAISRAIRTLVEYRSQGRLAELNSAFIGDTFKGEKVIENFREEVEWLIRAREHN